MPLRKPGRCLRTLAARKRGGELPLSALKTRQSPRASSKAARRPRRAPGAARRAGHYRHDRGTIRAPERRCARAPKFQWERAPGVGAEGPEPLPGPGSARRIIGGRFSPPDRCSARAFLATAPLGARSGK